MNIPRKDYWQQALRNSCELLRQRKELYTSSWNCMQAHVTSCKLRELHASSWTCMQAYVTACKLMSYNLFLLHATSFYSMQAHVIPWNLGKPWVTLDLMFMELHASLCKYMQAHGTSRSWNCIPALACNFFEMTAISRNCMQPLVAFGNPG